MVKEIRIYIEGGGEGKNTKQLLRGGFSIFFKELVLVARNKQIKWQIILCGRRISKDTARFQAVRNAG